MFYTLTKDPESLLLFLYKGYGEDLPFGGDPKILEAIALLKEESSPNLEEALNLLRQSQPKKEWKEVNRLFILWLREFKTLKRTVRGISMSTEWEDILSYYKWGKKGIRKEDFPLLYSIRKRDRNFYRKIDLIVPVLQEIDQKSHLAPEGFKEMMVEIFDKMMKYNEQLYPGNYTIARICNILKILNKETELLLLLRDSGINLDSFDSVFEINLQHINKIREVFFPVDREKTLEELSLELGCKSSKLLPFVRGLYPEIIRASNKISKNQEDIIRTTWIRRKF